MSKPRLLTYHHTQKAPWFLLLFAFAPVFFILTWVTRGELVHPGHRRQLFDH